MTVGENIFVSGVILAFMGGFVYNMVNAKPRTETDRPIEKTIDKTEDCKFAEKAINNPKTYSEVWVKAYIDNNCEEVLK